MFKNVLVRFNVADVKSERDRILAENQVALDTVETEQGKSQRLLAEKELVGSLDEVLRRYPRQAQAQGADTSSRNGREVSALNAGNHWQWSGTCWVQMIQRYTNVNLSRASWGAPCGSESDPVTAQWWMNLNMAVSRTEDGGWLGTGACFLNPGQYVFLNTDLAWGWSANNASLAKANGFPSTPPCGDRDHVRMWSVPTSVLGYLTFGTPHREVLSLSEKNHVVTSWGAGRDRLYNDYVNAPTGQNTGTYYCGWVWPDTYGAGGSIACGIELSYR